MDNAQVAELARRILFCLNEETNLNAQAWMQPIIQKVISDFLAEPAPAVAAIISDPECMIFAAEIDFVPLPVPLSQVIKKCKDIWDHPDKYSSYQPGTEDAYYRFTRFLWVRFPGGQEERLAKVAHGEWMIEKAKE